MQHIKFLTRYFGIASMGLFLLSINSCADKKGPKATFNAGGTEQPAKTIDCTLVENQNNALCSGDGTPTAIDCTLAANQNDSRCQVVVTGTTTQTTGGTTTTQPVIPAAKTVNFPGQTIYGAYDRGSEHLISCSPDSSYNEPGASCNGWLMEAVDVYSYSPAGDFYKRTYGNAKIIIRLSPQNFHDSALAGVDKTDFCNRAKTYASGTQGIAVWVVGNEPNINGMSASSYAALFNECYQKLKDVSGIVIPAGIAPWTGSSEQYFADMLNAIDNLDGMAIHSKTHCNNASCFGEFDFRNFLAKVPSKFANRPAFITEANPHDQVWGDDNEAWIVQAYELVNAYNKEPSATSKILAMILFRWHASFENSTRDVDGWEFIGINGFTEDFRAAWDKGYTP